MIWTCSPKISEHFEQNKYIRNYSVHIVNDSLEIYFKTPADIDNITEKKELKKTIRKAQFKLKDPVLAYGVTDNPPYEYYVTISENCSHEYPEELIVLDTLINNRVLRFIGHSLDPNSKRNLGADLSKMFKSLEYGPEYRKQISTVFDVVKKFQTSNKFFAALTEISEFPAYDLQEKGAKQQMELTFSSFLGKNDLYDAHLNKLESGFIANERISQTIKENLVYNGVMDTIIREAQKHKIVMINENHFYPNHRIFVAELLPKLKEIGYKYLALEALDTKQDSLLNLAYSYPTLETGFYTREQNYAVLIRKAKEWGFEFVAYENTDNSQDREIEQAENLYGKTFKVDPKSKVVVLAGIDHILENATSSGKKWMACIFKNQYNIDPLTISQTHLNLYRNQIESNYGIINSNKFEDEKLNSIDYLVLNKNMSQSSENLRKYQYRNDYEKDVQVALFHGSEIVNEYDYTQRVPYFTTIIKSRKKRELFVDRKQETYLYTFDKSGKRMDKQIIPPVN